LGGESDLMGYLPILFVVVVALTVGCLLYSIEPSVKIARPQRRAASTSRGLPIVVDDVVDEQCKDSKPNCPELAARGECETDPGFMVPRCPVSCKTCYLRDPNVQCQRRPDAASTLLPNELPQKFEKIVRDFPELEPEILRATDPHILYFGNFLSDDEISDLLAGYNEAGHRFAGSTELDGTGKSVNRRTSQSMPCNSAACWNDERVLHVHERASKVLGMPLAHQEFIQIVKYEKGQQYVNHHDTSNTYHKWPQGHRVFTLFLYLSDVEEGGDTVFPRIGVNVKPKKGAAVLWSNVKAADPGVLEDLSLHAGSQVEKGTKVAGNLWIYQHDFRSTWTCGWFKDIMHGHLGIKSEQSRYRL